MIRPALRRVTAALMIVVAMCVAPGVQGVARSADAPASAADPCGPHGDPRLPCPPALQPAVRFWIRVYTEITTNAGFIHDQENLSVVYETLHFDPDLSVRARQHRVDAEKRRYRQMLLRLAHGAAPADDEERHVVALWGAAATPERLAEAADDVRFQLGQADRFRAGLIRAGSWQRHIAQVLSREGVPPELAALPDVESSFNPAAWSKDGAAGLWQFMRSTGRRFLRINATVDERLDPFRESEAAAQLLAYNYQLLGSWPLAITAYNHGAAGMLRAREELGTDDIVRILHDYHSRRFGFASRNFYVSFLAALAVASDPDRYFGSLHEDPEVQFRELRMPEAAGIRALEQALGIDRDTLQELNPALRPAVWRGRRPVPAGYQLRLPSGQTDWSSQLLARRLGSARAVTVAAITRARPALAPVNPDVAGAAASAAAATGAPIFAAGSVPSSAAAGGAPTAVDFQSLIGSASRAAGYYLVGPQDTVGSIAAREGIAPAQLLALNALPNGNFLYTGEPLRLIASEAQPGGDLLAALTQEAVRESVEDQQAVALESRNADVEPVSVQQQADGAPLVPGLTGPESADPEDYSVAADGTIRVVAAETLGHYADWLAVSAADLRRLNHLRGRTPVRIGARLKLDFRAVSSQEFEQRRRAYHAQLQAAYFASHRIVGTREYVARRGDSLWNITRQDMRVPVWLLQQYNPDLNFGDLKPGTQVAIPRVEEAATL